ncbi:hypothetical protein DACRYDRAFT_35983, partial [Dacryopinax primogenitus]
AFLGTLSILCIFIKDFAMKVCPLEYLKCKGMIFAWGPKHQAAFNQLKADTCWEGLLCPINYESSRQIILVVDSSNISVGYVSYQNNINGKWK